MFSNIRNQIKELAKNAVMVAEAEFGKGRGQEKKKLAIDYVIRNLSCSTFMKNIISILLSSFIDNVIEIAVTYMNSLQKTEGE